MNERIKLLVEEANTRTFLNEDGSLTPELHKFAELIVKDFLDIANEVRGEPSTETYYVIGYDRACEKIIDAIKESYGVEE